MAILEKDLPAGYAPRHKFTRDAYHAMGDAGILDDCRVELIEGEIIEMAPMGSEHAVLSDEIDHLLEAAFGPGFAVRTQVPIALGDEASPSEPQPDIVVVKGRLRDYLKRLPNPADILLIVEVADKTLKTDRKVKSALYAASGIPEYWIVNLVDKVLEVHREPSGSIYKSVTVLKPGDAIASLSAPKNPIAVSDCLP